MSKELMIERSITIFSNETERLIDEVIINHVKLEDLKKIFHPPVEDPLMYDVYDITEDNYELINSLLPSKLMFDFKSYSYFVECSEIR